jgi:hypothetical protein
MAMYEYEWFCAHKSTDLIMAEREFQYLIERWIQVFL